MRCDQASPRIAWRLQAICLAKCYSNLQSTHRLRPKGNDVRAGHAESPFLFRVQLGCNWGAIADRRCGCHGRTRSVADVLRRRQAGFGALQR